MMVRDYAYEHVECNITENIPLRLHIHSAMEEIAYCSGILGETIFLCLSLDYTNMIQCVPFVANMMAINITAQTIEATLYFC